MTIPTITRPTTDVDIVTDLDALRDTIELTNHYNEIVDATDGTTEAEASHHRRELDHTRSKLADLAAKVEASTITLTLQGLPSNQWNQTVARCTTTQGGRTTKDLNKLATLALAAMTTGMRGHDGEAIPVTADELAGLAGNLADSQILQLLETIQALNVPATSLPKETLTLLRSEN
ncbi:hypothetical protein [Bifidobacterium parmae]|uniref:Uncharacterized protein n=1 Tax=Bifidobacterium parmae TaxID=361854 RepID=A0A2N5IVI1_9BIFI|nr:hypothetical protein [Bifidobacterium parmae]PLS25973.1 hypothetical protein Uis4E_2231 [Bifidobacterium parmae]